MSTKYNKIPKQVAFEDNIHTLGLGSRTKRGILHTEPFFSHELPNGRVINVIVPFGQTPLFTPGFPRYGQIKSASSILFPAQSLPNFMDGLFGNKYAATHHSSIRKSATINCAFFFFFFKSLKFITSYCHSRFEVFVG